MSLGAERANGAGWRGDLRRRARLEALPRWWSAAALVVLLVAGGAVLGYETRGTTFWADEWQWILTRRGGGPDAFLQPHNQHFSLVPVALYKILFAIFGLRHYWPYRAMLIGAELILTTLIFIYARRRVGGFFALLAAALIMLFGPGWQDVLWPFQTAWIVTVLAGVGALLALDRRDRAGDIAACMLLGVSLASASPGLAIAVGLTLEVLARRRWRDLWIVAIPIVVYGIWWLSYQQTVFNRHALLLLPRFVFNSAAGTVSALTGLAQVDPYNDSGGDFFSWGTPLLVVGLIALVWRLRVLRRIPPRVITLCAILLAFWLLTGIGRAYVAVGTLTLTSTGHESRYLYIGAVFIVLLMVELLRGRASAAPAIGVVIGILAAAAILSNIGPLQDGAGLLRNQAQYTRAELETMNLSRNRVAPGFVSNGFIFGIVTAQAWFAAERDLGSPPLSVAALTRQPDFARQAADAQLVKIQGLTLHDATSSTAAASAPPTVEAAAAGTASIAGGCVRYRPAATLPAGAANSLAVTVPAAGLLVRDSGSAPATVSLRRFSDQSGQLGTVTPGGAATVQIRPDLAPRPWHAQIAAAGAFSVCSLG